MPGAANHIQSTRFAKETVRRQRVTDGGPACPDCGVRRSVVFNSRVVGEQGVRRRRACCACDHRWTTYEVSASELAESNDPNAIATMLDDVQRRIDQIIDHLRAGAPHE